MRRLSLAVLVALATFAHADPPKDPAIPFERYKLPNGLEVILVPDAAAPLVSVNVWYHVGSGCESPGKSGFAHLFEHMMFQGSLNVGKDNHFEILKKIGSEQINGTTNSDRTNYFEVVPANQLETALWLESDRMGHLLEFLDKGSLDNQIDTVKNERRQNYDNVPYRKALFAEYEALYPVEGHPYRHLTIGKFEDLTAASVDDVKGFFKTWYVPANATLTIAGDFDSQKTRALIAHWFGSFPTSKQPKVVTIPPPAIARTDVEVVDKLAKLPQITFAWHSPAKYAPGDAELEVLADALDREGPGRLYKTLVYDKQLAQSVNVSQGSSQFSGIFEITVTLRSEADPAEVKKLVFDQLAAVAAGPVAGQADIDRTVARREASTIRGLESVFTRSQLLQGYNHYLGDPGKLTWDLDRYRTTTPAKIQDVAKRYLAPEHVAVITTTPGGAR